MTTKSIRQFVSLVTLACVAASARAADTGFFVTANAGVNILNDITVPVAPPVNTVSLSFNPGFRADLSLGYTFLANETLTLSAAGESGFIFNSLDQGEGGNGVNLPIDGELYQVPFLGKVVLTLLPDSKWTPFISAGGGGVYSRLNVDSIGGNPVDSSGDETDPAFQGELGLRYQFNENCTIGVSYKCLVVLPSDDVDEYLNHSISFLVGFRF